MPKRPSFQFYPGDWVRDPVAGCSLDAQGLWLRMMIVAHDSDKYGHLEQNGTAMPADAISRRCGCESVAQYESLLAELFQAGVPSRTPAGVIFSRRMVRDEELRETRASGGADSQKNPNVPRANNKDGGKGTPKDTGKDGCKDTSEPAPREPAEPSSGGSLGGSPSSSSSSSNPTATTAVENSSPGQRQENPRGDSKPNDNLDPNPTDVAYMLCKAEGWTGKTIPLALADAIKHVAPKYPDPMSTGKELVRCWKQHEASAEFPNDVGTFFAAAHYRKYLVGKKAQAVAVITDTRQFVNDRLTAEEKMQEGER